MNQENSIFYPGSRWLYIKIYCGYYTLENILVNVFLPNFQKWFQNKYFTSFYFIRYHDPNHHLRIRFYNTDAQKLQNILFEINKIFSLEEYYYLIHKIEIGTYVREINRYGKENISFCEEIFFHDSYFVLKLLKNPNLCSNIQRFYLSILNLDQLFKYFHFNAENKMTVLNQLSISYFKEFNCNKNQKLLLDYKYRNYKSGIVSIISDNTESEYRNLVELTKLKFTKLQPLIDNILKNKIETNDVENIVKALHHMFMNRLFMKNCRKYELVVYYFMQKYYTSEFAITKLSKY